MAYLARNHKNKQNDNTNNPSNTNNSANYSYSKNPKNNKKLYNNQGFQGKNNYKNRNNYGNVDASNSLANKLRHIKEKQKKEMAKKAIVKAVSSVNPVAGAATEAVLKTKKGEKLIDAYAKADSPSEGIKNVQIELKKDAIKRKIIMGCICVAIPILLLILFMSLFAKNADSQIYSNENGGTVESDNYGYDDKDVNIFANYPGLYEKIEETVNSVGEEYQMDIDKYLIIATLIAPIENGLITPVDDHSCGEANCYYFRNRPDEEKKSLTWSEFLESWASQSELLAKMQFLTYINNENEIQVDCGSEETMEQYAKNDLETNTFPWYGWLNPVNWFRGFVDSEGAEVNAKCVEARNGETKVPTVRVSSIDQGTYYFTNNANGEYDFVIDPETGGVYFWNLINKNGFIHEYLKDYLSSEFKEDPDKNYEINRKTIVDTVNYIYSYYESIRRDCNDFLVMNGNLETIDFQEDGSSPIYTLDFEDVFVGGSVLATYGGARGETLKAQVILTRSEAYNYIVEQGGDVIVGSAKMGCWWEKYNGGLEYNPDYIKEHYPEIYEAVQETRGIVVTNYGGTTVLETQYDAFCPTTREARGNFYYLPDGQRNLPIDIGHFNVPEDRVKCPCFQNRSVRPDVEFSESLSILTKKRISSPPQDTLEECWTPTGETKTDDKGKNLYGYKYDTTGGHGEGVSQHGMAYFSQFGYDYQALIKLFLERDGQGISFKRLAGTIEDNECTNHLVIN